MTAAAPPVRFGILSTAAIGAYVAAAVAGSSEVQIVAVASRSQAAADAFARDHGIERAHGSYEALLADPDIEAVYISVPNALHVRWSIRALEAGKHVLCEKPLGRRSAEVDRVHSLASDAGLLFAEAFMYRHHPQTKLLAELVASEIGDLRTIRVALGGTRSETDDIRLRADLDGGALMDVGCYCVSMARLLAGEPDVVCGTQVLGPTGVDLRFAGLLMFPGNVVATFDCGLDQAPSAFVEAVGSHGTVRAKDPFLLADSSIVLSPAGGLIRHFDVEPANSYRLELEDLARAIRGTSEPLLGRDDAMGQTRTIEALQQSAAVGSMPVPVGR